MDKCTQRILHNSEESFSAKEINNLIDFQTPLEELFSSKDISDISKFIAHQYVYKNFNSDFNTISESKTNLELKKFIDQELGLRIKELKSYNDNYTDSIAEALEESLNYSSEWFNNITSYFNSLKLNYNEETIEELEEEGRSELIKKPSFERSSKEGISSNVKLRLALLTNDQIVDDIFQQPIFIPLEESISSLQKLLHNKTNIIQEGKNVNLFNEYLKIIKDYSNVKPYFKDLVRMLEHPSLPEYIKTEFTQAFTLGRNNFLTTNIEKTEDSFKHDVLNVSNVNTKSNIILNQWKSNFINKFISDNKLNKSLLTNSLDKFKSLKDNIVYLSKNEDLLKLDKVKTDILNNLNSIGVENNDIELNYYLNNNSAKDISYSDYVKNLNNLNNDVTRLLSDINDGKSKLFYKDKVKNPFKNQKIFTRLAKAKSFFSTEGNEDSIRSDNKTKWAYSYPSYLSNTINAWKKDNSLLEDLYRSSPYNNSSKYMEYLLAYDKPYLSNDQKQEDSKNRINKLELAVFNSLNSENDEEFGVSNVDMSINDAKSDIVNKILSYKKDGKSYLNTPTPADKATQYQLHIGYNIDFIPSLDKEGNIQIPDKISNIFYDYYKSEYVRIADVYKDIENLPQEELITHYHIGNANGKKSQLFPSINNTESFIIFDDNGKPILDNLDVVKDQIKDEINKILSDRIITSHKALIKSNIIKFEKGAFTNNAIDSNIYNKYAAQSDTPTLSVAANFYVNGIISNVEYSKMFSGDVAYYKNLVDYKKRIPATYTDGLQVILKEDDPTNYNIAVIEGVEISSPYMEELNKYLPNKIAKFYKNINSTDAQAWITPDRWKFLISRTIGWNEVYESAYNKMINGGTFTNQELKKVAQPLKGVYFDINSGRPTYLKYSQAVLLPNLIKGSQLENVYNKMTTEGVDELITIDGVKVGAINPVKLHNEDGSINLNKPFNVQSIKNSGWKLQQNLPTKTFKQTDVGSQIQKNILEGLAYNLEETFDINGEEKNGLEVYQELNDLIGDLSDIGMANIMDQFDIDQNFKINNPERFYSAMIDELKARGGNKNLVQALEAGITPYGIAQNQQKLMNVFFALMNKKLIKIQTNGGSFIQMSNFGIDRVTAEESGVIWLSDPKPLAPYQIVDGKVKPAQILISGSFIAKYIPNYKDYSVAELKEIIDPKILSNVIGYRIPNQGLSSNDALEIVGILPEETGDTVIAYTEIPTKTGSDFDIDKMYLMIPNYKLQYSDSLNKRAIKFVKEDLELTREDLVDELINDGYTSSFLENKKNNELEQLFIEDILLNPTNNSELKEDFETYIDKNSIKKLQYVPSNLDNKLSKQNRLIELYKSILLHPNNLEALMTPIDFDYVKDDIVSLYPAEENADLDNFDVLKDVNLKYDFLAGKAGLGQVVNALVDHIRGLFTNTYYEDVNIGWGNKNELDETVFDKEFSEELNGTKFKISNTLSAFTNAYVDIAKDPYVTRGNFVTQTTNTATMMIRAGVHPFIVNSFIGQPILKEYVEFVTTKESKITDDTRNIKDKFKLKKVSDLLGNETLDLFGEKISYKDIFNSLVKRVDDETGINYGNVISLFNVVKTNPDLKPDLQIVNNAIDTINGKYDQVINYTNRDVSKLSLDQMRSQITNTPNLDIQLSVLDKFYELQDFSKEMRDFTVASKLDVEGAGKNITSLIINKNRVLKAKDLPIKGFTDRLIDPRTNLPTFLGNYNNNIIETTSKIVQSNPKYFLSSNQNVIEMFNIISIDSKGEILVDNKLGDKLENEFYTYIMSNFKPLKIEDGKKKEFINSVYNKVSELKTSGIENFLIDELELLTTDPNYSFLGIKNTSKSDEYNDKITDAWWDLFSEEEQLANDLVKYSFITTGFQPSLNSFYQYIPYKFFLANNINNYVLQTSKELNDVDTNFIEQFYENNLDDKSLVRKVFNNQISKNKDDILIENVFNYYVENNNKYYKLIDMSSEGGVYTQVKTKKYKSKYGKIIGYNMNNDNKSTLYIDTIQDSEYTNFVEIEDNNNGEDPFNCEL